MKLSLSSILSFKQELEHRLQAKEADQRSQLEDSIKSQTNLAFAELSSFFSQLSQFKSESEIAAMKADRTASDSFIKTQIANVVIGFASLFQNQQSIQSAKLQEYLNQKNEIENKIDQLKASIASREANLTALEGKIATITTAAANPGGAAVSLAEIKSVQASLEQTQKQTIESIKSQKEVTNDLKEVAVQKVNKEVEKVKEKTKEAIKEEQNKNVEVMDNQNKQLTFDFFETSKQTVDKAKESIDKKDQAATAEPKPDTTAGTVQNPPAQPPVEEKPPAKDPQQLELDFGTPPEQNPPAAQNPPAQQTPPVAPADSTAAKVVEQQTTDTKGDKKVKDASNTTNQSIDEGKKLLQSDTTAPPAPTVATPDPDQPGLPLTITAEAKKDDVQKTVTEAKQTVEEVKKVTEKLTDQVDKKLEGLTDSLASSQEKLTVAKDTVTTNADTMVLGVAGAPGAVNPQSEELKQTAANLKDVHQQQKDILEAQKESIAVLEESKEKLIGKDAPGGATTPENASTQANATTPTNTTTSATNNVLQNIVAGATTNQQNVAAQPANIVNQALNANQQQEELSLLEKLERKLEELMEKIKNILESMLGKEEQGTRILHSDAVQQTSSEKHAGEALAEIQKEAASKESKVSNTGSEIFFISSQLTDVDKVMDNYLELAQKTEKIIVDRNLNDVYEALSAKLGKDKVILDRRGQDDRRTQTPRRTIDELIPSSEEQKSINAEMEKRSNSDRRAKNERRQADLQIIQELDDIDILLEAKDNNLA